MDVATRESTTMTRNMVEEYSLGQMVDSTMVSGEMVSKMDMACTSTSRVTLGTEDGRMESVSSGLLKKTTS